MDDAVLVRRAVGSGDVSKTPKGGGLWGWLSKPKKTTGPPKPPKPPKPRPPKKKPKSG